MGYRVVRNDELYHFGVMGMHWGIRRYQPYGEGGYNPKHEGKYVGEKKGLTDKQKKAIKIGATIAGASIIATGAYFCSRYYNMNAAKVIKAGKEIQHLGKQVENLNSPFYASYLKADNYKYLKNRENHWKCKKVLTSTKDIKIPSKKECLNIYKKIANINEKGKDLDRSYYYFMREVGQTFPDEKVEKMFNDFCYELGKNGYSAVRDANDQYGAFKAASPIIIFNNLDSIKLKKLVELYK